MLRNAAKDALQTLCFSGRFVWRLPWSSNAIALTFDDGPHPVHTEEVLDVLAETGVRAIFFLAEEAVEKRPLLARKLVSAGHAVSARTFDHKAIPKQLPAERRLSGAGPHANRYKS